NKTPDFGGTGQQFDWQLILRQPLRMPWILAGGIGPENIVEAAQSGAMMLDLNSRFESALGIKDYDLLNEAISRIE
ncbi:MAG: phosphoribosylanthranilate isomerase, partial [Bacteroidales bacterium]|nr:phosphoribosylanthranilate isomerase [Bacteroidales bacterium]